MILAALAQLYDRLADDPARGIPRPGWSRRKVAFALALREDGSVAGLADLRSHEGKKPATPELSAPDHGQPRTSAAKDLPYFLCDTTAFLLGADDGKGDKAAAYFASARTLHEALLAGCDDPAARAILAFFHAWGSADRPAVERARALAKEAGLDWAKEVSGVNLAFKLDGTPGLAHEREALKRLWDDRFAARAGGAEAQCLVTGRVGPIARTHPGIKLPETTGNGAMVVSFNKDAFASYGHDQGANAPVGEAAAFAYTTALNELVRRGSRQKLSLGGATVVFWADRRSEAEGWLVDLLGAGASDDGREEDRTTTQRVGKVLEALRSGRRPGDLLADLDQDVRFYVLGIGAPGGSRVAVRFWLDTTLGELLDQLGRHVRGLDIENRYGRPSEPIGIRTMLRAIAFGGKDEELPAPLAGAVLHAVLAGGPYPQALLAGALQRMRAEHGPYDSVSYVRAAVVKACLCRNHPELERTLMTGLNADHPDAAYQLGRLFAALERAQQLAIPGANTTIKDRSFGAASATPRAVFPSLIRLAQHHISKSGAGWLDGIIGDIVDKISDQFPAHLSLERQGLFALGYYHQRNALWTKKQTES